MALMLRKKKKPVVLNPMPWATFLGKRCKARLKRGEDSTYHGRCDLKAGHYTESGDDDHCLERGMEWVRWYETPRGKQIRIELAHYEFK
jgi:hypothetical protein